jgi:uncharacterized membrane protein YidH (DUF202 family)
MAVITHRSRWMQRTPIVQFEAALTVTVTMVRQHRVTSHSIGGRCQPTMRSLIVVLLVVLASLGLVFGLEQWLPYAHNRAVVQLYLQATLVFCVIGVVAMILGRIVCRSDAGVCSAIILMLMLLLLDPYSFGRRGGHWGFQVEYPWQLLGTAVLGGALLAALVFARQRQDHLAVGVLSAEFLGFAAMNGIYAVRDGVHTRSFAGEFSSPFPLILLLGGLALRVYVQVRIRERRTSVQA